MCDARGVRVSLPALALALLAAACGDASLGGPSDDDGPDAAEDEDPIDARPAIDARPPIDARACVDGDARIVDGTTGHCLIYVGTPATWSDARSACSALGGELATIGSLAENNLVLGLPTDVLAEPDVWLGASDVAMEGTFVWASGEAMGYTNWRAGEPNDGGAEAGPEDCMILEADTEGTWDDRGCGALYPYLCERS